MSSGPTFAPSGPTRWHFVQESCAEIKSALPAGGVTAFLRVGDELGHEFRAVRARLHGDAGGTVKGGKQRRFVMARLVAAIETLRWLRPPAASLRRMRVSQFAWVPPFKERNGLRIAPASSAVLIVWEQFGGARGGFGRIERRELRGQRGAPDFGSTCVDESK